MIKKILEVKDLKKSFTFKKDIVSVIDNISFDLYDGEIISIVGTSGCGKSTLLNIIGGLTSKTDGEINYFFDINNIGYMLQNDSLFPWYTNIQNARLGCLIKRFNNDEYIEKLIKKYGLEDFKNKYPHNISGGMRQRIALIRTISTKPKLLLLDEPFAALDYQSRLKISKDIYELIKENNIATIIITHDIAEAISMSDKVIVLSKRPCVIKNTYTIKLNNNIDPIKNRKDEKFNYYYELICKDLDLFDS